LKKHTPTLSYEGRGMRVGVRGNIKENIIEGRWRVEVGGNIRENGVGVIFEKTYPHPHMKVGVGGNIRENIIWGWGVILKKT
jgi:hypothetical protein